MSTSEIDPNSGFQEQATAKLQGFDLQWSTFLRQLRLTVPSKQCFDVLSKLKAECSMDMLVDVTGVDHLEFPGAKDRFEVVYCLLDTESGQRLIVSTFLNEPDLKLPSAYPLWTSADWMEREVYDMFGIVFEGHPNFKRLLLPDEFASFPLRKDYPVQGRGERHNFPVLTRSQS